MSHGRLVVLGLVLFAPISAEALAAQERDVCRLVTASNLRVTDAGTTGERHEFQGPVHFTCAPDVTLRADSAVGRPAAGRYLLIGDVLYRDSVKTLTSRRLTYDRPVDRLFATGDVELHDLRNGSVIRGPELEHYGAAAGNGPATPAARDSAGEVPASRALRPAPDVDAGADAAPVAAAAGAVDTAAVDTSGDAGGNVAAAADGPEGLEGPNERAGPGGPGAAAPTRTIVRGGAHALIRPEDSTEGVEARSDAPPADAADAASSDSAAPPLEIDAERIEITGERWFHAVGDVRMKRGESRSFSDEATYDRQIGRLTLDRAARIEDEAFELLGERIEATETADGGSLRRVHATGDAVLLAEDMRLRAPGIRIFFEEGELHRLVATDGDADAPGASAGESPTDGRVAAAAPDAPDAPDAGEPEAPGGAMRPDGADGPDGLAADTAADHRPRVDSPDLELTADSLDIRAPGERLERVTAVGDAYALRAAADSTVEAPPVPELARDWVRGDTITGYFAVDTVDAADPPVVASASDGPPTGQDSAEDAGPEREPETRAVLERIVAVGEDGRARSVYRIAADSTANGAPHYNYVVARRLVLSIRDGSVTSLEAEGPLRGMDLQPIRRTTDEEPPPADSPPGAVGGGR